MFDSNKICSSTYCYQKTKTVTDFNLVFLIFKSHFFLQFSCGH